MKWSRGNLALLADEVGEPYLPDGIEDLPYIGLEHVEPQTLQLSGIGSSLDVKSSKQRFLPGDILFGTMRPYFRKVVRPSFEGVCSTEFSIIRAKNQADNDFVFYSVVHPKFIELATTNSKGDRPRTKWALFSQFPLEMPPAHIRRRIGTVLSAYDDLIANNRRRIMLLEEAAWQLYREWFVRFRFPGHKHICITKCVPEGWERAKVGSLLAKIENKQRIPKDDYLPEGPIPCVDQSADFIGGFTDDEMAVYSEPLPVVVFGDHTRALKFVNFAFARGADGTQVIYPNTDRISSEYLYFALREIDLSNYFYARHFKFLKEKEVLLPEVSLVREFTAFAKPCFEQIQTLRLQGQKLRAARDLLLPRLISGEIAV